MEKERKIELLQAIIEDQNVLINKLQGYLIGGTIHIPKKIVKPSNKTTMEEARIGIYKFLKRQK
tara:strand:- start:503 stop:694 length:192 start_codon:yes stop_codon:yes gene_type:complete